MTLSTGLASADWAGPDPAVTQVQLHRRETQQKIIRTKQNGMLLMGNRKLKKTTNIGVVFFFCFMLFLFFIANKW